MTESDLADLAPDEPCPAHLAFSRSLWQRASLHKSCHRDPKAARRVSDHLDLVFLDTVVLVRCMQVYELREMVELWVAQPQGEALPGLLWSLCTDARDEVHVLGNRLCHEAANIAMRALVEPGSSERLAS